MSKTSLIAILFSTAILAAPKLPKRVPTVDLIVYTVRAELQKKIKELPQNYLVRTAPNSIVFESNEETECSWWGKKEPKSPLAGISYETDELTSEDDKNSILIQSANFLSCVGRVTLIESLYIKNKKEEERPIPKTSFENYLKRGFKIDIFSHDKVVYTLRADNDELIFQLKSAKNKNGNIQVEVWTTNSRAFTMLYEYSPEQTVHELRMHPARMSFTYPYFSKSSSSLFHGKLPKLQTYAINGKPFIYVDEDLEEISGKEYDKQVSSYLYAKSLGISIEILKIFVNYLPSTEIVQASGSKNKRILKELQILINKLATGDYAYVTQELRKYVAAITSGEIGIEDNRKDP